MGKLEGSVGRMLCVGVPLVSAPDGSCRGAIGVVARRVAVYVVRWTRGDTQC
jgi:hypothetical protein